MGSVYSKRGKWYLGYKDSGGAWRYHSSGIHCGDTEAEQARTRRQALGMLTQLEAEIAAGRHAAPEAQSALTVDRHFPGWNQQRKDLGIKDWRRDAGRYRAHIAPVIGHMRVDAVLPQHIREVVTRCRMSGRAQHTVYNVYSLLCAFFRDAAVDGHCDRSPCILTDKHLGPKEDADPAWRRTAIYTRDELVALISDPRIPWDRQVLYALQGLAALRIGEAAGLQWQHIERREPLSAIIVARSFTDPRPKNRRVREMPVHPVLAAMLAEWRLGGWPAMMGRAPRSDDLVVPMPASKGVKLGEMRTQQRSHNRLVQDLRALGFRHRRGHDLRRTMITLAVNDGADELRLEQVTHNPSKKFRAFAAYTEYQWATLCAEVAKLRIERPARGRLTVT